MVGVGEREALSGLLVFPKDYCQGAFVRREAKWRSSAEVDLVGPKREGVRLEGDEDLLGVVELGEFGKSLGAVIMEGYDGEVSDRPVGGVCSCLPRFVDARDHQVVREFWVEVTKACRPVSHHGVKVKAPKFVFGITGGGCVEEW